MRLLSSSSQPLHRFCFQYGSGSLGAVSKGYMLGYGFHPSSHSEASRFLSARSDMNNIALFTIGFVISVPTTIVIVGLVVAAAAKDPERPDPRAG